MEKFLEQMARVMQRWPDHAEWSINQLVDYTQFPADDVVAWMSFGAKRQLATDSRLTYEEGEAAINALKAAHAAGSHISFTAKGTVTENIRSTYEQVLARNRSHLQNKDWRRAYRNLVNFLNEYKTKLPLDLFTEALSECLRLAAKADATPQETFGWLDSCVTRLTEDESKAGVTEAMDFINAYGDALVPSNIALVENLINRLQPLATKHGLAEDLEQIHADLLGN